jgi:hypothetical protein
MLGKLCRLDKQCGLTRKVTLVCRGLNAILRRNTGPCLKCISKGVTARGRLTISNIRREMLRRGNVEWGAEFEGFDCAN